MGNINHKILLQGPGLADQKLVPFPSRAVALQMIPMYMRQMGQPVIVIEQGKAVEYWWHEGIQDSDLVLKTADDGIEEAPNDGNVYVRGVLSWIRGVAGSVYDAFSLQVITDIQSILTSIDLINAEILAIKNDIDNVNTTVEQLNTSLSNVITSVNQLSISVDSIIVSLGALDGRVDILESVAQGILNHIALLVNEIDLLKTAVNNFTNHVSNTQIHVPTPQGQVNGRMLETLNNALVYVDKPAGGGGLLGIINALSRDSANRIRQIRIDFGENKFKETRCAYHTTGTAIGQINFQEIKDDITNVWIRLQFSYTGAVLVAPTIRTNITNWSITRV